MERMILRGLNLVTAAALVAVSLALIKAKDEIQNWQSQAVGWQAVANSVAAGKCAGYVTEIPPYDPQGDWSVGVNDRLIKAEKGERSK